MVRLLDSQIEDPSHTRFQV